MGRRAPKSQVVTIAKLPRKGVVPAFLLTCMVMGPGLLNPQFALAWFIGLMSTTLIVLRVLQLRLEVSQHAVVVTNFFRTITVPLAELIIETEQPLVGYLELRTLDGRKIQVGAAPSWGKPLETVRNRLIEEVSRRGFQ